MVMVICLFSCKQINIKTSKLIGCTCMYEPRLLNKRPIGHIAHLKNCSLQSACWSNIITPPARHMFHDFCSETTRHRFTFKMKVRFRSKVSWCKFHGPGETSYSKKIFEYLDKTYTATLYGEEENKKKNYKQTEKSSKITTVHVYVIWIFDLNIFIAWSFCKRIRHKFWKHVYVIYTAQVMYITFL